MNLTIQADETGSLVLPPGSAAPGARFRIEARGEVVILWRDRAQPDEWWAATTPAERVAWLKEWIASLPPSPGPPLEATRRDTMYD